MSEPTTTTTRNFHVEFSVRIPMLPVKGVRMPLQLDSNAVQRDALAAESGIKDRITKRAPNQ
jgi:hypothetical protein